jgi:hypothetical protein
MKLDAGGPFMATEADMARDLAAELVRHAAVDASEARNGGCVDYVCYCHESLPAAIRRALTAEGERDAALAILRRLACHGFDVQGVPPVRADVNALAREVRDLLESLR